MTNVECCMLGSTVVSRSFISYISNNCLKTRNARIYLLQSYLKSCAFFTDRCESCLVLLGVMGDAWRSLIVCCVYDLTDYVKVFST